MPYRALVTRILLAALGGGLLVLAFPPTGVWPLAVLSVALLALATAGAGWWRGVLVGAAFGAAFFLPALSWSGIYVGNLPWVALSLLQTCFIALTGGLHGWLSRSDRPAGRAVRGPRALWRAGSTVRPVVFALAWVVGEGLRSRVPYGGFPWVTLGTSQADSPFGRLAALGGVPLIGFAVTLCGALLVLAATTGRARRDRAVALGVAAAIAFGGLAVPLPTDGAPAKVMAVQGNVPQAGLDFNAQRRAVLDDHVQATLRAAAEIKAGRRPQPDLVVWPENSSDIDPTRNPDAQALIMQAVDTVGVPMIVGTLLDGPKTLENVSLTYQPGRGIVSTYVKQHPVPFAEYIPDRAFWRHFSSEVDLVRRDFVAGHHRGIVTAPAASGATIRAGLSICFEVAYGDILRDDVLHGANLLVVQTNNATFGYTDESVQQLAVSRIRAIEFGRSVVHVSTVGVSALITPDGVVHQPTSLFTQAVLSGTLPLRSELTLAARVGDWPQYGALGWLLALAALTWWRRSRRRPGETADGTP